MPVLASAVEVHDQLLKLIAPATPDSIRSSSLYPSRNFPLFVIGMSAIASFVVFIVPILFSVGTNQKVSDLFSIVGSAGLGSSFYALYTASDYIKTNTFNSKYNNTYLIRFGLGILAGIILAFFLQDFLNLGSTGDAVTAKKISVAALALVGGYASEAVVQILNRVSETLVTLVSGSGKEKVEAAKQKAEADAERKSAQKLSDNLKKLQDVQAETDPAKKAAKIQDVMQDILNRK